MRLIGKVRTLYISKIVGGYVKREKEEQPLQRKRQWEQRNMINNELLINLDKLHTTQRGAVRIKRNLSLDTDNVVGWCKTKTSAPDAVFKRIGKNWYVTIEGCTITVNAHSFTIITAHREKEENKVMSEKYTFQDFLQTEQKDHRQLCVPQEGVDRPDLCGPYRPVHGDFGYAARQHGARHSRCADLQTPGGPVCLQSKVLYGLRLHFARRTPAKMPQQRFHVLARCGKQALCKIAIVE